MSDDETRLDEYRHLLAKDGYKVWACAGLLELAAQLGMTGAKVIVVDDSTIDAEKCEVVREVRESGIDLPILVALRIKSVRNVVAAFRHGADNVVAGTLNSVKLRQALNAILRNGKTGVGRDS